MVIYFMYEEITNTEAYIMLNEIGFTAKQIEKSIDKIYNKPEETAVPRKSIVQVQFPHRDITLAYYNDAFDLHPGDVVFVDGKLEGTRGRVISVNYNFKIKLSAYKRVIAVADVNLKGKFHMAGSHFLTFDKDALPVNKVKSWFIAPDKEEDEYAMGTDDQSFLLEEFKGFDVSQKIMDRGYKYYMENKVVYLCVDGSKGYAIVEGSKAYEVEFTYMDGSIANLVCSCYCSSNCKHEVATLLQLREILDLIEKNYPELNEENYFASVCKGALFSFAIDRSGKGEFTL